MTTAAVQALFDRVEREVDERLPAAQVALARDGKVFASRTFSRSGAETDDTRFLMWSCTKAVTAGVIWQLVGEGALDVERTVASYLPDFATNGKDAITVEQLLLHTAGIPRAARSAAMGVECRPASRIRPLASQLGAGEPVRVPRALDRMGPGRTHHRGHRQRLPRRSPPAHQRTARAPIAGARRARGRPGRHRRPGGRR